MDRFEPRRELGRTGFRATVLGIGDVADRTLSFETCVATLRRALEAGLNVIDTAPLYEDGFSEEIVGAAVQDRERVFVIDKIESFTDPVALQIEASLGRLQMRYADAFVFHSLSNMAAFQSLAQPGGGFDQLSECVRAGKCRFRGISSHNPEVLRASITMGLCDVVMFAVGPFVDSRYVTDILPLAKQSGVGTVCFKTFGAGKLVADTEGYNQPLQSRPRGKISSGGVEDQAVATLPHLSPAECLHYTLTLDPDVALLGLSFPNEQDAAFEAARTFRPLTEREMHSIATWAEEARRNKGPCWWNPQPDA